MMDDTREMTKQAMSRHLGATLRAARIGSGATPEEIALQAGMNPEVYKRVEKGRMTPGLLGLGRLCTVLGLDLNVALGLPSPKEFPQRERPESPGDSPRLRHLMPSLRRLDSKQIELLTLMAQGYVKKTRGGSGTS